ncbi:MAG: rhodanese-like domain-containing protein [Salinisphaera sp.]|jgi:rhodanese-related sulfurtransferase|nr:rhodanese-like domain-containing protein [Salinisphaera sp.]
MQQILEFVTHHPFLWGALVVLLIALAANELWRLMRGDQPVSSSEAVKLMNDDAIVVDVRSSSDFKKGHILGAKHIPLAGITERAKEITRDSEKPILLYCAAGTHAPQAATKLRAKGYTNVHVLRGGLNNWQGDGLPVTRK